MKRVLCVLLALVLTACPAMVYRVNALAPDNLISETAVLIDADTGQVLYSKNMDAKVYPASTTKVLTALVVLENCRTYEIVTVSNAAVKDIAWDESHIALSEGEQLTVDSALYALMLPSANDSANALAEHVSGTNKAFTELMNQKALQIGATSSHFANPHGLHDDDHYTTAYDMALITRYAMQNELFRDYFGASHYNMPPTNLNKERPFTNYQYQLVQDTGYYNPDVIGGKVGFTNEARHTMTTVARKGGRTLVCVVMNSPVRGDKFEDTDKLLSFGFEEFSLYTIPRESYSGFRLPVLEDEIVVGSAEFSTESEFSVLLHNSVSAEQVSVSFERPDIFTVDSDIICTAVFSVDGTPEYIPAALGSLELSADVSIMAGKYAMSIPAMAEASAKSQLRDRIIIITCSSLLFIIACVILSRSLAARKRRRQRLARLRKTRGELKYIPGSGERPAPRHRVR